MVAGQHSTCRHYASHLAGWRRLLSHIDYFWVAIHKRCFHLPLCLSATWFCLSTDRCAPTGTRAHYVAIVVCRIVGRGSCFVASQEVTPPSDLTNRSSQPLAAPMFSFLTTSTIHSSA